MNPIRSALLTAKRRRHYDDGGTPVAKKDAAPVQVAAAPAAEIAAAPAADTSTAQAPGVSQADIENLYKTVANRSSDPEGMAYWQQQAANGMSLDQMQAQFQQAAQDPLQQAKAASMEDVGAVQSYGDNIPQPPRKPIYLQNFDYSQYDNPLDARYAFLSKALNPTIAAAMMGNYGIESFNNPNQLQTSNGAANGTPIFDANNMPKGYGAAMWGGTRLNNPNGGPNKMGLFDFAQAYGYDPNSTEGQDRFAVYELTQNPEYADAYKGLIGAGNDINKATQIFGDQYETPKNLSKTLEDRQATAQMFYNYVNNPSALSSDDQAEIAKTKSGMMSDPTFQQYAAKKAADAATAAAAAAAANQKTTTGTDTPIDTSVTQPIIDQTGVGGNQNIMNMLNSNPGTDFQNLGVTGLNNYNFTTIPSSGGVPSGGFNNGVSVDPNVMQNFGLDFGSFARGGTVHHALRLAHRYARGGYADGGDPPPDDSVQTDDNVQPGDSLLMRERQTITPSSLAKAWTPPEDTIGQDLGPQQQNIMQNYPQMLSDKMVGAGQAVADMPGKMLDLAKYPGQVMSGEQTFDPHSDADIQKALDLAGMTMLGGAGGAPEGAVLGSGPVRKIGMGHNMPPLDETFNLPQLLQTEKRRGIDILNKTEALAGKDPQFSKFGAPLSDLETTISRKNDLVPYKVLSPEQLYREGAYIAPALGDLTGAGYMVHEINGIPLSRPVDVTGGGEYMRSAMANAQGQESAWASRPSTAQTMLNKINSQVPEGSPVYMSHTLMGVPSMDSSHMVMQGVLRQIPHLAEKIDPIGAMVVDDFIRSHLPAKAQKDWPGIMNADAAEAYLMGKPGTWSSIVVKALDKSGAVKAGFPDVGATRFAMMEPRLAASNQLSSGFALSRLDPGGKLISNPNLSHETYGGKMPSIGGYAGGFEHQVPMEAMFSDWAKGRPATYTEEKSGLIKPTTKTMHQQAIMTQVPVQKATQQWLDTVMGHMRQNPQKWGYLAGGAVKP